MLASFAQFVKFLITPGIPRKSRLVLDFARLGWKKKMGARGPGAFGLLGYNIQYGDFALFYGLIWEIFILRHYALTPPFPVRRIIDAGANIGLSALFFQLEHADSHIVCFEPEPRNFALLKSNIESNGLQGRIECHNVALAGKEGTLKLFTHASPGDVGVSVHRGSRLQYHAAEALHETEVPCVTLSTFLGERTDILKIDVEGAEDEIFQEIAARFDQVGALLMEYHHFPDGNPLSAILKILEQHRHQYLINTLSSQALDLSARGYFKLNIKSIKGT